VNKKQSIVACLIGIFLLSGCTGVTAEKGQIKVNVPFDFPQNKNDGSASFEVIKANIGEEFTVTLESNKTTGYEWQLAEPLDKDILLFVNSKYITNESNLIGSGGKEIWIFKALKAGKAAISFRYVRPWEKNIPPAKEETFSVIIKE
jgi:predicted secreted protein